MKGWEQQAERFMRGETNELSVGKRTLQKMLGGRGMPMAGASMIADKPKKKRKGTEAAKARLPEGLTWGELSKRQKSDLRLLARAEKGSAKAAAKLAKRLGMAGTSATTAEVTPKIDMPLAKAVLPHTAADPVALAGALAALRAALSSGRPGGGGWR